MKELQQILRNYWTVVFWVPAKVPSKLCARAAAQINNVPRTRNNELGKPFDS